MSQFLNDMAEYCREIDANIYYIGAVENGGYEAERIAVNLTNNCSDIYSVAKAFTVTAVGLLVDRGLMSVDEKVCDILGDLCPAGMDERWRGTTVDMVLRHRTGLSNGDVGIVFADKEAGGIRICFEHLPVPLQFHDLPPHESAFAMTVHKAQGSGFDEVSFPMPREDTPLLTRELFYTALTRAAKKITIYGNADMVQKALERESCRAAKLAERIVAELKGEQQ